MISTDCNFDTTQCSDLHQIVSRILVIRKDKKPAFVFEAGDIVCWLVNPPIAKLDLSADCREIYKSYAEYWYRNQRPSADLYKVKLCNPQFLVGVPAIYVVKVCRECHPLDSFFDERSFGQPLCLCRYASRNKLGTKKKMYGIKQYLRELESQRRCRSMLP